MHRPSVVRVVLLTLALVACANYLLFVLNPQHIGNLGFYLVSVCADLLAIFVLVSSVSTALYFELFKSQYYQEIATLRRDGADLAAKRVAANRRSAQTRAQSQRSRGLTRPTFRPSPRIR